MPPASPELLSETGRTDLSELHQTLKRTGELGVLGINGNIRYISLIRSLEELLQGGNVMRFIDAQRLFTEHQKLNDRSPKTIYGYGKDLEAFWRFYVGRNNCECYVEDVTADHLEAFIRYLKAKGLKVESRNRIVHAFRGFYKFLVRRGYCAVDVSQQIETVRTQRKERVHLTEEEVHQLIVNIDHPLIRLVTQTLVFTGLRISECLNLRLRHVDFENQLIHVIRGKGGKNRVVPMSDKLYPLLIDYRKEHRAGAELEDPFFGTEVTGRLSPSYYNAYLQRVTEKKLRWTKRVSAHTLRHTFASLMVKKDINIVYLQKLLGHSSLATTSVYTHATTKDLSEAINML